MVSNGAYIMRIEDELPSSNQARLARESRILNVFPMPFCYIWLQESTALVVLGVPAASFQRHLGSGHGDEPFLHIICAVSTFPGEVRSKPATSSLWLVQNGFPSSRTVIIPNILDSRNLYKKIKEKTKTGLLSIHCSSESVLKLLMANYSMISVDVYASPSPSAEALTPHLLLYKYSLNHATCSQWLQSYRSLRCHFFSTGVILWSSVK